MKTRVKICGITRKDRVDKLLEFDIWALGFRDKDVPDFITLAEIEKIISDLPPKILSVFGVAYKKPQEIIDIVNKTNPNVIQFQKGGTPDELKYIKRSFPKLQLWKTIETGVEISQDEIITFENIADMILIHSSPTRWKNDLKITNLLKKPF
ncbi:MAG: hypothetical protein PHS44_07160, partial [Candidatus Dojkabacteria bacterium]|nr:hypothetical protein [Candidatus Dojkabacteria bacterium]